MSAPSEHFQEQGKVEEMRRFFDAIPHVFQKYPEFIRIANRCVPFMGPDHQSDVAALVEKAYWKGCVDASR